MSELTVETSQYTPAHTHTHSGIFIHNLHLSLSHLGISHTCTLTFSLSLSLSLSLQMMCYSHVAAAWDALWVRVTRFRRTQHARTTFTDILVTWFGYRSPATICRYCSRRYTTTIRWDGWVKPFERRRRRFQPVNSLHKCIKCSLPMEWETGGVEEVKVKASEVSELFALCVH